ncbi:helix-turn-helix transcriptional regulator [Sphingomonas aerophila]|uniref:helix-turn-helix transcriptional regulator n=1 Tax=Sphingomonas aerophila TaxID=1344948 RepID=UPI0016137302|nr:helix-turn-helix transcriptional regulator [Sphingomonas aerophila]
MIDELANRLREAREARGWTQAELAARMGVSRKTVNTVENGVFVPSTVVALKAARVLERPVESLFHLVDRDGQ